MIHPQKNKQTSNLSYTKPIRFLKTYPYLIVYVLLVAFFVFKFSSHYLPDTGFTNLTHYGMSGYPIFSDTLKETNPYIHSHPGYDGQYYGELALHPLVANPEIQNSFDSFTYRARRILFSWTAYLGGLGKADAIVQAFAIQNIIFWLLLAVLLCHWLPPRNWQNLFRYAGILFAAGSIVSVMRSLLELPSLFLICLFLYFLEKGKNKFAIGTLALSVLGRETNVLACIAHFEPKSLKNPKQLI